MAADKCWKFHAYILYINHNIFWYIVLIQEIKPFENLTSIYDSCNNMPPKDVVPENSSYNPRA